MAEITSNPDYRGVHHYQVVALALRELERQRKSGDRHPVLELLENELTYETESERWGHIEATKPELADEVHAFELRRTG